MAQETKGSVKSFFYNYLSKIEPNSKQSCVFPHTSIEKLKSGLWHVTGVIPNIIIPPREMLIYQLPDSTLLIHSAIALDEHEMEQLESLGKPTIMVVPNRWHRFDAAVYKQRYQDLSVVCPAAARTYVEEVVPVDGTAEEILPSHGIVCHQPVGIWDQELVYELPLPEGRAPVFTDILLNMTDSYMSRNAPLRKPVYKAIGAAPGYFGATRVVKQFFMSDRDAYRQWLEELADRMSDLQAICVGHGSPILNNCPSMLREAAQRLL